MAAMIEVLFWIFFFLLFYTYVGYGLLVFTITRVMRLFSIGSGVQTRCLTDKDLPEVTLLVAAYNEADCIASKIENSLKLEYPPGKLRLLFVTDGSTDGTEQIVQRYQQVGCMHQPERKGKIAATNRVMKHITSPVVVFTDANTILNPEAVLRMVAHYCDPRVGGVSGEKRVVSGGAAGNGEGLYWKYESTLKKLDSELYTVVGAAGELFSVRRELFVATPEDTISEDFYMTLRIAQKGYRIAYEPGAFALESPSDSVREELKRKIRIAAGGIQSIVRLRALLNPFRYGVLTFQYVSHRVLRWTAAPVVLPLFFVCNAMLVGSNPGSYGPVMLLHLLFYMFAVVGWALKNINRHKKFLLVPYYFLVMNYAVYAGFARYLRGNQTVLWERAKRSAHTLPAA